MTGGKVKSKTFKFFVLGALAATCMSASAKADEFSLGGTANLTTDYIFRGVTQSSHNPAIQASIDATYGIFYAGIWASSVDFGGGPNGQQIAPLELDYYVGVTPTWGGVNFDFAALYYTYPGAYDPAGNFDYMEIKTAASYTFGDALTIGVANYWTPDYSGEIGDGDALELSGEYAFSQTLFNFFTPSVSAMVGWQWTSVVDFTYWNAGLTLGFLDRWAADLRYWDSDLSDAECTAFVGVANNCDSRLVGSISVAF